MHLMVVRHAIAEDAEPDQDDASRELTRAGKRKFRKVARGLRALGWRFDRVMTSPWTRAASTAEMLVAKRDTPIVTDLLCQSPRAELLAMIADIARPATPLHATAVVGHQPWLAELVGLLAFGDARRGESLELKKGAVVWLDGTTVPGGMTLRSILPPDVLRSIR